MLQGIAEQQGQVESGRSELCDHVQVVHQPNNGLAAGQADKARTARKEGSNGIEVQGPQETKDPMGSRIKQPA